MPTEGYVFLYERNNGVRQQYVTQMDLETENTIPPSDVLMPEWHTKSKHQKSFKASGSEEMVTGLTDIFHMEIDANEIQPPGSYPGSDLGSTLPIPGVDYSTKISENREDLMNELAAYGYKHAQNDERLRKKLFVLNTNDAKSKYYGRHPLHDRLESLTAREISSFNQFLIDNTQLTQTSNRTIKVSKPESRNSSSRKTRIATDLLPASTSCSRNMRHCRVPS